jgi:hypothetical protein
MAGTAQTLVQAEGASFVFFPNRYAHETWRAQVLPAPLWDLLGSRRTEGRLAAFVVESLGLGAPVLPSFDTSRTRFCLLPSPILLKVAQHLGVALNAARLGKVIDGKLVSRIKRELGREAYDFALRRAPLITSQTDPMAPDLSADPLVESLARSGANFMGLSVVDLEFGLKARFKLKLPKSYAHLIEAPQGKVRAEVAWQVVRKVVREVEPEWSGSLE